MIEPSLAIQIGLRARLLASPAVLNLVGPDRIIDGRKRPESFPCIILGEAQTTLAEITYSRDHINVSLDIHCWTNEDGLADVKTLAGACVFALTNKPQIAPHALIDGYVSRSFAMRDRDGVHGHAVITYEALVEVRT